VKIVIKFVDADEMTQVEQASLLAAMRADAEGRGDTLLLSTRNFSATVKVVDSEV
jgi:hypothetical protein